MERIADTNLYFVAVLCPAKVNVQVTDFKFWMRDNFGCKVALKSPAHITLIPPFRLRQDQENKLAFLSDALMPSTKKTEVILDGFDHFDKRVLFVKVEDSPLLATLKSETEDHFVEKLGGVIKREHRKFHPHVTIANRDLKTSDFDVAWKHFSAITYHENFYVTEVNVMKLVGGKWQPILSSQL